MFVLQTILNFPYHLFVVEVGFLSSILKTTDKLDRILSIFKRFKELEFRIILIKVIILILVRYLARI